MSKSTQLSLFEEEMSKLAQQSLADEAAGSGVQFVSTKGGVFTYKGSVILTTNPNNALDVVILSGLVERSLYTTRYDPANVGAPDCAALGQSMHNLRPFANSPKPGNDVCDTCPKNQWGSAANGGKGKACSEKRRLLIMTSDSLTSPENVATAEVAAVRVPTMSVKGYGEYLQRVAGATKRPLLGVVTSLELVPDPKSQFKMSFKVKNVIDDAAIIAALIARSKIEVNRAIETGADTAEKTEVVEQSSKF